MWVAAFIGMATSFAECSSHSFIKNVMPMGSFVADRHVVYGAQAGMRWMGVLFAVFFAHRLRHNFQRSSERTPLREP